MSKTPDQIEIVYEHADFIIVNKPVDVPMHNRDTGIISLISEQIEYKRLFLVHRLDTPTSGCLMLAKNKIAANYLSQLFFNHQISKFYIALLDKKPKKKQGAIIGDMINRRGGNHALLQSKNNPAITQFFSYSMAPSLRLSLVRPLTGKTHQIRVAMKSLGSPIIGDKRYGGTHADRLYLHAWNIRFDYHTEQVSCFANPTHGKHFFEPSVRSWLHATREPQSLPWPKPPQRKVIEG